MDSLDTIQQMLRRQPFSELIPFLSYDKDKTLYALDSGIGFIFECSPIYAGQDTVRVMRGLFEERFPPGTSIQFMLYASPSVQHLLDSYVLARENVHGDTTFTELARKRRAFILSGVNKSIIKGVDVRIRNMRLIVSVVVPCSKVPDAYEANMPRVQEIKEKVFQPLNAAHLNPRNLDPAALINLMGEIINPGHPPDTYYHYDPKLPIKDQIVFADTEINVDKDHLIVDGKYFKSLTVRQYPQEWHIGKGVNFCGDLFENAKQIGEPFFITLNCQYADPVKTMNQINRRSVSASYQAFGPIGRWFPKLLMKKQHFDNFAVALENGESPFYAYLNIVSWSDNAERAASVTGTFQALFRSMNFILQEDKYIMLPLFLQSLPMCYLAQTQRDLRRRKTFTTSNVAELLPIQADWSGFGAPAILLISRRGQIQMMDVFANPMGGYSGVVVAATGAGKSFFANYFIESYLGLGAKIWVIDVGRSYEKTCSRFGGDFIVFDREFDMCINPFSRVVDLGEEMAVLKSIIAQMASRQNPLDDLCMSFIEEAIKESFALRGNEMTVTNVAEYLSKQHDPRQRDLGKMLYPYTAHGAYAPFFEGKSTLNPQANYIVLELEELKSKRDLQEVVLLTLIYQIQQEMINRDRKKIVLCDESWDLLKGGTNTSNFMETGYRRIRKYKGSFITVTQSIADYYQIPAGKAIMENADFMFLLRQRNESIESMRAECKLSLSDGMYEVLKSIHTDQGNYSEIFVNTPVGIMISRLALDRFFQLLYSNKAEEFQKIKRYMSQGMDVTAAIDRIVAEEARGESAA